MIVVCCDEHITLAIDRRVSTSPDRVHLPPSVYIVHNMKVAMPTPSLPKTIVFIFKMINNNFPSTSNPKLVS